jgi:hypothetical protein
MGVVCRTVTKPGKRWSCCLLNLLRRRFLPSEALPEAELVCALRGDPLFEAAPLPESAYRCLSLLFSLLPMKSKQ